jgi:hypothetical protein
MRAPLYVAAVRDGYVLWSAELIVYIGSWN